MSIRKGKAVKILSKSFVENHSEISEDEAQVLVVKAEQKIRILVEEQRNDAKLNAAKQIAKDLSAGYTSALQYEKAKIAFLLDKIDELQTDDDSSEE